MALSKSKQNNLHALENVSNKKRPTKPKVSVIMPVYNVENYISQSMDSALSQTFKDFELICINDCSTDNSLGILKEYAGKDNRIKIIDLDVNKGVSNARNIGLEEVKGDYIAFLDPDDWWEKDTLEKALNKIISEQADIVQFGHNRYTDGKLTEHDVKEKIEEVLNGIDYLKFFHYFAYVIWDKIYKTSLIKENKIIFPLGIHPSEDVIFSLECFLYSPKITFLADSLYNYRIDREGSAMNRYDKLLLNQIDTAYILLNSDFFKKADDIYKKQCLKIVIGGIAYFIFLSIKREYPEELYLDKFKEFVEYFKNSAYCKLIEREDELRNCELLLRSLLDKQNNKSASHD